ncbi:MAG: nucleotidyltransferase family protein [Pseudomonadota bacterium]
MTASVLLFAAGFGTRMGALTADRPKPLIEVAGTPLIDHALALAEAVKPPRIVANLHYKAQMLADHLASKGVITSLEWPEILETGGGLRQALPLLGPDPVMTLNPDVIWSGPNPLALLLSAWDPARMDGLLLCLPPDQTVGRSGPDDFTVSQEGRLSRGPGVVYGGAQILKTDMLSDIPDKAFSLNVLWDRMIARNRLSGLRYPGKWCDVGRPEGIALAERLIREPGDV